MIRCPYCHSTTVGRVGTSQYYCWSCYYEFAVQKQGVRRFRIVEDGSLTEEEQISFKGQEVRRMDVNTRKFRRMMKSAGKKAEQLMERLLGK